MVMGISGVMLAGMSSVYVIMVRSSKLVESKQALLAMSNDLQTQLRSQATCRKAASQIQSLLMSSN